MIIEPVLNKTIYLKDNATRNIIDKPERKVERIYSKKQIKETKRIEKDFVAHKTKNNFKLNLYFVSLMLFVVGIIMGSIVFRLMINEISVQEMIVEKFASKTIEDERMVFNKSFARNIKLLIIYWIVGVSVVGAPLILLLCVYKGFTTAFVISACLLKYGIVEGNLYVFKNIFLYYIFLILGIIVLTTSSLRVVINIFKDKKDIRYELIRHSIFTLGGSGLFLISTLIESKMLCK